MNVIVNEQAYHLPIIGNFAEPLLMKHKAHNLPSAPCLHDLIVVRASSEILACPTGLRGTGVRHVSRAGYCYWWVAESVLDFASVLASLAGIWGRFGFLQHTVRVGLP